jgi:glycosyltransferase involved in cell wall biosynthesis
VAPGDDRGLADALEAVAHDDNLRQMLRQRGRDVAASFSWDTTALQHIAIYDELQTS